MSGKLFGKSLLLLAATALSFFITLGGMARPAAQASELNLTLGKQNSKVEVYVFSDWFCPSCIKAEPVIESVFPTMLQKAKVLFVDKPIHPEAMNFVPYHLSFAVKEKGKYLELRKALFALAKRTKNPSVEDVRTAIAPLKVTYQQLSFLDVSQSMARFQALSDQFKVKGTPTMIIVNTSSKKSRTLYGANEITAEGILKALRELD
jgi:protein-disulfide isomerase